MADPFDALGLLRAEAALLWGTDPRGRLTHDAHHLAVAEAGDGRRAAVAGAHLPPGLASAAVRLALAPGPDALARCRDLLADARGPVDVSAGPSHLVPRGTPVPPCAGVVAHTGPGAADLAGAAPPTWEPGEWADLVAGRLGPWAAVRRGGRVVALCFTPVAGPEGAEAGVWTDPGHRGRGFAAAATARWATSFPGGRPLFHSTSDANRSSQRVAARLGLPRLGRLWKASRPGRGGEHHRRPWAPG